MEATTRKFGEDDFVSFYPEGHRYLDKNGKEYLSTTKLLKTIEEPFNANMISMRMVNSKFPGASEEVLKKEQKKLLDLWETKRKFAGDHGTRIHYELEQYFITGNISEKLEPVAKGISNFYKNHYKHYDELLLYNELYGVAGTTDKAVLRSKKNNIVDFGDYKTNVDKGITFDSHREKENKFTFENKYFLEPFNYVEACNYFSYSLQLSSYAYYAESTYGMKVGKLNIFFIDEAKSRLDIVAVPYMRCEVIRLLKYREHLRNSKKPTGEIRNIMIDENNKKEEKEKEKNVVEW